MLRRLVISAIPIAVAAIAMAPVPATAATAQPCWLAKAQTIPEPQPIQVDQATIDRATNLLNAVAQNTFDQSLLAPQLQTAGTPNFFGMGAKVVGPYGPVQTMIPFEQQITANGTSTYFRARFAKETLTWVITIDPQDKVAGLSLRRTPVCKIFNMASGAMQY